MSRPNGNGSSALKQKTPIQAESSEGENPQPVVVSSKNSRVVTLDPTPVFIFKTEM